VTAGQSMDPEYEDDEDDEDEDEDEDQLSPRDRETFMRAAAAWKISAGVLDDSDDGRPGATPFGPASFGLIALGLMLDVAKKAGRLSY
jgi:RNA-dependent RNA polymerase